MREQERWHEMMGPKVSMMKFRLPWRAGETEYLDGEVWTQPYAKARSTETRLVVEGPREGGGQEGEEGGTTKGGDGGGGGRKKRGRRRWVNQEYEEQCFFFNTVVRPVRHVHGVRGAALGETWDYAREVEIWREYLRRGGGPVGREEENERIARLSVVLTEHLGGGQGREWLRRVEPRLRGEGEEGKGRGRGQGPEGSGGRRHGYGQERRRKRSRDRWQREPGREGGREGRVSKNLRHGGGEGEGREERGQRDDALPGSPE
jgi:hypothetical protein